MPIINLVYEAPTWYTEIIECDFKSSEYWFAYSWTMDARTGYGRDANGFYTYQQTDWYAVTWWAIPSSIYSWRILRKVEIDGYPTWVGNWVWIGTSNANTIASFNWQILSAGLWVSDHSVSTSSTANQAFTLTVDLDDKTASSDVWDILSLSDTEVTWIQDKFTNGQLTLSAWRNNVTRGSYAYLSWARFYF